MRQSQIAGSTKRLIDFRLPYNICMPTTTSKIVEMRLVGAGLLGARLSLPANMRPDAGQYLLASTLEDEAEALPLALFPSGWEGGDLLAAPPLPGGWSAGMQVGLRGPLGKGFSLPATARRVALGGLDACVHRLLPLVGQALAQGADVALYCDSAVPHDLPLAVEVLPLGQLASAAAWADYLALDLPYARLGQVNALLGLEHGRRCPCLAEALVVTPLPCGGLAECGVCAVRSGNRWRLACKDGPVFGLDTLER